MTIKRISRRLDFAVLATFLSIISISTQALAAKSEDGLWEDVPRSEVPTSVTQTGSIPDRYRVVRADFPGLEGLLRRAPIAGRAGPSVLISLPLPDGSFQRLRMEESPIMAPELAAKFPQIKTYRAQGVDNPAITARLDLTPKGFHAVVHSGAETIYIDPVGNEVIQGKNVGFYVSYFKRDFKPLQQKQFQCHFAEANPESLVLRSAVAGRPSGEELRTYRIAVAATGEYTQFHGGTVGNGLAAIVTTMNRVNFIYEREVAVRMQLVAGNDLIIYTDPATDPYTNSNGITMLDENQANLDAVIGTDNYDIGHVFSTGGGGVARLGSSCNAGNKAQGVTGQNNPVGDPFDVDYVAHEIGHQFGANHTFNGNAGACSGGNRNGSTAYEPGSGSTIMAYAGICGNQNLQPNSDAYFHGASFDEIINFTTAGAGNGCPVITTTLNTMPDVDAGSNYTIPLNTPFTLNGTATDPDGNPLTYGWEEFDLGPAGAPNFPSGNAPIFRSFTPTTSPSRTFPNLSDLLNGTSTLGEVLPTYERTLNFRLTVRDNRAGGGGVSYDTVTLTAAAGTGPFAVTHPNSNLTWRIGTKETVTWNVAGTNTPSTPICTNVNILLSTDGGNNFSTVLVSETPNDGKKRVTVPDIPTTMARVKVECADNIFFDISDADFTVTGESNLISADGFES